MAIPLISLLERELRPRILLVGNLVLDRYVWGDVERISPEAPIPVLRVGTQEHRLGRRQCGGDGGGAGRPGRPPGRGRG